MDNNIGLDLFGIISGTKSFVEKVKKGDGMGIPEERKEEFFKAMKEKGVDKQLDELEVKMKEMIETITKVNSNGANN
jgi:hypothetical protein